ncbi:MAG: peptidylprolyl isomerase [Gemmatimonadota bacterium]|nr:peptidylprolyl isomerase [Gemmatimonadota bacterium]MDE2871093.1 peptidylprolyl isomerase [Gemmatimonadota bacterium]
MRGDGRVHGGAGSCLLLALPWLAACDDLADRGLVARAGDWTLTEERLAELLVLAQPFPLDSAAVHEVASHWVGTAALVLRSAAGDSLLGSEALEAGMWLDRREALLTADREARLGTGAEVEAASAAEVFNEGDLRLVAHTLRRAGPGASSSERLRQQRVAERLLATLVEGGSWDGAVAESEDAETRGAAGLLGLFARSELPSTLDRVVFRLEPGQVSAVTQSSEGFHILYRPRYEEVGSLYREQLRQRRLAEADAVANGEERVSRGFAMLPGAVTVLGRMAGEPVKWLGSAQPLAEWEGGRLTASVVARYLLYFPAQSLAELAAAGEEARVTLIQDLGTRELRLGDAAAREGLLSPAIDEALVRTHADEIEYWHTALELGTPDSPSRAALGRYMESLVSRQTDGRSLPPLLKAWLLARTDHRVRARGVLAAIVIARGMLAETGGGAGSGR